MCIHVHIDNVGRFLETERLRVALLLLIPRCRPNRGTLLEGPQSPVKCGRGKGATGCQGSSLCSKRFRSSGFDHAQFSRESDYIIMMFEATVAAGWNISMVHFCAPVVGRQGFYNGGRESTPQVGRGFLGFETLGTPVSVGGFSFPRGLKQKDPSFWFQGPLKAGFQKPCVVGSSCLCGLLGPNFCPDDVYGGCVGRIPYRGSLFQGRRAQQPKPGFARVLPRRRGLNNYQ